jgi:hypothetical protein
MLAAEGVVEHTCTQLQPGHSTACQLSAGRVSNVLLKAPMPVMLCMLNSIAATCGSAVPLLLLHMASRLCCLV